MVEGKSQNALTSDTLGSQIFGMLKNQSSCIMHQFMTIDFIIVRLRSLKGEKKKRDLKDIIA